jgi:hypothetical protein
MLLGAVHESGSGPKCRSGHEPHDGHCRAVRIGAFGSRYSEISTAPTLLNRLAAMSFGTTWLSGGSGRLLSAQPAMTVRR